MNHDQNNTYLQAEQALKTQQNSFIRLQIELKDALHIRRITTAEYNVRSVALSEALHYCNGVLGFVQAARVHLTHESNLGLPSLDSCTPEELKICAEFLDSRLNLLTDIYAKCERLAAQCQKTSYGQVGYFGFLINYSWLKKLIEECEKTSAGLVHEMRQMDEYVIGLGRVLTKGKKSGASIKDALDWVMKLFGELDKRSSRIANLRQKVEQDNKRVHDMRIWIQNQRSQTQISFQAPPSTEETVALMAQTTPAEAHMISSTKRKLKLAKDYVRSCIQQERQERQ